MHFILGFNSRQHSYGIMVFLVVILKGRTDQQQRFQQGSYSPILYVNTTAHAVIFRFHKFIKEQKFPFFSCCMLTRASFGIPISCTVVNPKIEFKNSPYCRLTGKYIQENPRCLLYICLSFKNYAASFLLVSALEIFVAPNVSR